MKHRVILSLILILVILLGNPVETAADEQYAGRMAVVLVIDGSGSMVHNDPDRVRVEAARKAVDILKDGDYLAVVEFSTEAQLLVRMREVGGEAERREISALIDQAGQRGDTDILSGLRAAFHQFAGAPADARKFVILLSDGESDVPGVTGSVSTRERYFAETETLLERYREQGWAVHCIAFHEEGAGAELQNIAQKTGGEYQFVTSTDQLKNIFANILLAAKYPPGEEPVFHATLRDDEYLIGERLEAEAYITIGEDRVLPGPYLELTAVNLVLAAGGVDPVVVPFSESGDGLFRAACEIKAATEYEAMATITGRYRGQEIEASVDLGTVTAAAKAHAPLIPVDAEQVKSMAGLLLPGTGFVFLAVVTFLMWRARLRERVGGELRVYGARGADVRYAKYRLKLGRARRSEVSIATYKGRDVHFVLDPPEREFGFMIRTVRNPVQDLKLGRFRRLLRGPAMLYEVVCLPGTAMQMGERLRTRSDLYHGDVFEVGGYTFEFVFPRLGGRPGGENVLDSYLSKLQDEPGSKRRKIITLRLEPDK